MQSIKNKIISLCIIVTLMLTTSGAVVLVDAVARDFDGDITTNPWADLFVENDSPNKVVIEDPSSISPTKKVTKSDVKSALKTSIKSATKKTKKSTRAKIVLKKVTKVKGARYQIKYATNKKFKKAKLKSYKKNQITLKKLKAKKRYYIKARAYVKANNGKKVYGKWTKRKLIKIKKKK